MAMVEQKDMMWAQLNGEVVSGISNSRRNENETKHEKHEKYEKPWHRDPVCGGGIRVQQTRYTRHFLMCTERRVALLHHIRILHKVRQRNEKLRNEMCMRHDWNSNFLVPASLKPETTNSTS